MTVHKQVYLALHAPGAHVLMVLEGDFEPEHVYSRELATLTDLGWEIVYAPTHPLAIAAGTHAASIEAVATFVEQLEDEAPGQLLTPVTAIAARIREHFTDGVKP